MTRFAILFSMMSVWTCTNAEEEHRRVCAEAVQRYLAVLEQATDICQVDADCVAYGGGYGTCGGVVDRVTGAKLSRLVTQLHDELKCLHDRKCAPGMIVPACDSGRCVNGGKGWR